MPEGVTPYPRWNGTLQQGDRFWTVAVEEMKMAFRGLWSRLAILLGLVWGVASVIELYQFRQSDIDAHELQWFLDMLRQLRWFALAVAAAVGGPALLEDARRGALELYFSRSLDARGYLVGKTLAVLILTTGVVFVPAIVYFAGSFVFFSEHPDNWAWALGPALAYSLQWGLLTSGLALGLSAVGRSSRAAALLLFGLVAGLDIVVGELLSSLTESPGFQVLSPFRALDQHFTWFYGIERPHDFPVWWGFLHWVVLTVLGWALVAWKRPRVRGEERAR